MDNCFIPIFGLWFVTYLVIHVSETGKRTRYIIWTSTPFLAGLFLALNGEWNVFSLPPLMFGSSAIIAWKLRHLRR